MVQNSLLAYPCRDVITDGSENIFFSYVFKGRDVWDKAEDHFYERNTGPIKDEWVSL